MNTHLYRHYDSEGVLLYVGISLSTINRLAQHKEHSHWFNKISNVKIESFPTREEALDAERKAIANEGPVCNIRHKKSIVDIEAEMQKQKREFEKQKSIEALFRRYVAFDITYKVKDIPDLLGMTSDEIAGYINRGLLATFDVTGRKSGRWPVKTHKMITGWALIDFVEYLETKGSK